MAKPSTLPRSTWNVDLGRLGGKTDHFHFKPEGAYLVGDGVVVEPHSFDVHVLCRI